MPCNQSAHTDTGGVASDPLTRAGLRRPPRGDEPTGLFVVIEMAVLFCVSALAMVSIIVSIDDGAVPDVQHVSRPDERSPRLVGERAARTTVPYGDDKAAKASPTSRAAQVAQ